MTVHTDAAGHMQMEVNDGSETIQVVTGGEQPTDQPEQRDDRTNEDDPARTDEPDNQGNVVVRTGQGVVVNIGVPFGPNNTPFEVAQAIRMWTPDQLGQLQRMLYPRLTTFACDETSLFMRSPLGNQSGDVIGVAHGRVWSSNMQKKIMQPLVNKPAQTKNRLQYMFALPAIRHHTVHGIHTFFDGKEVGSQCLNYIIRTRRKSIQNVEVELESFPSEHPTITHRLIFTATKVITPGSYFICKAN